MSEALGIALLSAGVALSISLLNISVLRRQDAHNREVLLALNGIKLDVAAVNASLIEKAVLDNAAMLRTILRRLETLT